jgi:RNA polymerase sigma factor (sigma-70 family)
MDTDEQWDTMLRGLVDGDERAYAEFWNAYGNRLNAVARRRLPAGLQRRVEPEDVVQSVCRTFFRRVTQGKLRLSDSESLWRLLCAITLAKTRMQIRFHLQQRRNLNREAKPQAAGENRSSWQPAADEPGPEEAALFSDQLASILAELAQQEQQVVALKLEGLTNAEVASQLNCSERTVRRITNRLRQRFESILASPMTD